MSKTRTHNPTPPVALLIARHSQARVLCTKPGKLGFFNHTTGKMEPLRELNQLDVFESLCRKYAK